MKVFKKTVIAIIIAVILFLSAIVYIKRAYYIAPVENQPIGHTIPVQPTEKPKQQTLPVKTSLLLPVPFTPQAPTGNWDQLHNEACEEASSLMSAAYFNGNKQTTLDPAFVESEITKLTDWETKNFGHQLDTTSAETAKMIEQVYGLKTKLIADFTEQEVKDALNKNQLVLISENGRLLGNPNYKAPGPVHHMLLIKGYTKDSIITNDSGTRKGLNYAYSFSTIYNAAGDWDHTKNATDNNKKVAILVWKE